MSGVLWSSPGLPIASAGSYRRCCRIAERCRTDNCHNEALLSWLKQLAELQPIHRSTAVQIVLLGWQGAMALTVRLDAETEHCLQELQAVSGLDRRSLISQLIRKHWRLRRPVPTITELLDSPPPAFLGTLPVAAGW